MRLSPALSLCQVPTVEKQESESELEREKTREIVEIDMLRFKDNNSSRGFNNNTLRAKGQRLFLFHS